MALLLIAFLFGLYIFATAGVLSGIHSPWKKALAILVAILIPTADAIYGRLALNAMCKADAGLRIHRSAENVAGFSDSDDPPYESWVRDYGYSYVEGYRFGMRNKKTIRYESDGVGGVRTEMEEYGGFRSRYQLQRTRTDSKSYLRYRDSIVDIVANETMATDTRIIYFGGWVERAIFGLYGGRGTADYCPKTDGYSGLTALVTQTLKPIPKK